MKLVSISTLYGGARAVLCVKKSEEATCGLQTFRRVGASERQGDCD